MTASTVPDTVKALSAGGEVTLTSAEASSLRAWIEQLQKAADTGRQQLWAMQQEVARLGCLAQPETDSALLRKMLEGLDFDELCEMKKSFTRQLDKRMPPPSQFEAAQPTKEPEIGFDTFMI